MKPKIVNMLVILALLFSFTSIASAQEGGSQRTFLPVLVSYDYMPHAPGIESLSQGGQSQNKQIVDNSSALVQLKGDPLSINASTKPPQGKKIDFNRSEVKSYRSQLSALRNSFKAWLRVNAPNARVTSEFDISLNAVAVQLNGESLDKIATAPMVKFAQYEGYYYPTVDDLDLSLIHAMEAWAVNGGPEFAGQGVKVAILDTGIDIQHPCFSDANYPGQTQLGDKRFTNNKVIVAKVFNMKTPSRGYTPEAIQDHGTHVAGTVACNYNTPATVDGVTIPYGISGVAPKALLGNYNIFPGDVLNARSEDILNALEAAYADGFDIDNMSLGGGYHGVQDLLTMAVDNLDQANMISAVAAGNAGPGFSTVESPGSAARALTAGASTVGHFLATPVTVGSTSFPALSGDFAVVSADLTAPLSVVTGSVNGLSDACNALQGLTGKIALVSRGTCSFSTKIRNAQAAGAVATLVANNAPGDPIPMGQDGTPNQPTIPAYMVSMDDGLALKSLDGLNATISKTMQFFQTPNSDFMASFSGQGPTRVDFRIKPDVVAPGVNVLSSIPIKFCGETATTCFAFFQGTSMATPHLAGSAAIVKWEHPTWTSAQIRSAIVNTADQTVLKDYQNGLQIETVNIIGAGRENLFSAVNASVALDPVSISFGAIPSGSGQTATHDLVLTNLGTAETTFTLDVVGGEGGVSFSVNPASVTLGGGQSTTITVMASTDKRAVYGSHQGWLKVNTPVGEVAHAAVYLLIK